MCNKVLPLSAIFLNHVQLGTSQFIVMPSLQCSLCNKLLSFLTVCTLYISNSVPNNSQRHFCKYLTSTNNLKSVAKSHVILNEHSSWSTRGHMAACGEILLASLRIINFANWGRVIYSNLELAIDQYYTLCTNSCFFKSTTRQIAT